jgi:outer membrane immunogenic protein
MRNLLSAVAFLAMTAANSAIAADLPTRALKAPPIAPPPFSWTGCYIGAHLGGVVSEDRTTSLMGKTDSFSAAGFVGGGQVGCDYQFAPGWVVGAEGRAAWSSLQDSHASTVTNRVTLVTRPSQFTLTNDFLASATARLGYSFADRWLVFARGGAAWTREKVDDAFTLVSGRAVDPQVGLTRTGWTVGAGVEWAFAPHWSANLEYNFYDFGNHGTVLSDPTGTTVTFAGLRDTIHAVTAGVNYHF